MPVCRQIYFSLGASHLTHHPLIIPPIPTWKQTISYIFQLAKQTWRYLFDYHACKLLSLAWIKNITQQLFFMLPFIARQSTEKIERLLGLPSPSLLFRAFASTQTASYAGYILINSAYQVKHPTPPPTTNSKPITPYPTLLSWSPFSSFKNLEQYKST